MERYYSLYDENKEIIAAKLVVYPGDNEEYFTFMTPEAYNSIKEWMELSRITWRKNNRRKLAYARFMADN